MEFEQLQVKISHFCVSQCFICLGDGGGDGGGGDGGGGGAGGGGERGEVVEEVVDVVEVAEDEVIGGEREGVV